MATLLKRLKELEDTLKPFQAETHPSWGQGGQVFNELLAEAQKASDESVVNAVKPVAEQKWSRASRVTGAPICDTDAGSMLMAVRQLVLALGGARGTTAS
jgi:hypothetical protein